MTQAAPLNTPRVLITGGSRGIGARVALALAGRGYDIALCYRDKHRRAATVAAAIARTGRHCELVAGNLARQDELESVVKQLAAYGPYNAVILNASGGLEPDKDLPYAMAINCYASVALATAALPHCIGESNLIYVTSHSAHFYYHQPVLPSYAHVALSRQAGEQCLRRMSDMFARHNVRLHIISGDIVEGTITASLMDKQAPGFLRRRREQVGRLPSIAEFSNMIVEKALSQRAADTKAAAHWCGSVEPYLVGRSTPERCHASG